MIMPEPTAQASSTRYGDSGESGNGLATLPRHTLVEQEEALRCKYGVLPNRRNLLQRRLKANHLNERKFYDSADATLAREGRESVDAVGEDHPYVPPTSGDGRASGRPPSNGPDSRETSVERKNKHSFDRANMEDHVEELEQRTSLTLSPASSGLKRDDSFASSSSSGSFVAVRHSIELANHDVPPVAESSDFLHPSGVP